MEALTASKKSILKVDIKLSSSWHCCFLDVVILERSTARFHKTKAATVQNWSNAQGLIRPEYSNLI